LHVLVYALLWTLGFPSFLILLCIEINFIIFLAWIHFFVSPLAAGRKECILCPLDDKYFVAGWLVEECSVNNPLRSPNTVACDTYRTIHSEVDYFIYSTFCKDRKIVATLCYGKPSLIQCQQSKRASCNAISYKQCIDTYCYNCSNTADVVAAYMSNCTQISNQILGCDICNSTSCLSPLTIYFHGCLDRGVTQCIHWKDFCTKVSFPSLTVVSYFCLPHSSFSLLAKPPRLPNSPSSLSPLSPLSPSPSPPPPSPSPPSSPPPSAPSRSPPLKNPW